MEYERRLHPDNQEGVRLVQQVMVVYVQDWYKRLQTLTVPELPVPWILAFLVEGLRQGCLVVESLCFKK